MITNSSIPNFKRYTITFLSCVLIISGCNKKLDISDFDEEVWKSDRMACLNKRKALEEKLLKAKEELVDLSQQEIVGVLGKPEMQELYTRGQKFYMYYLTPAPICKDLTPDQKQTARLLYIRFSALNQVNEIFVK